MFRYCKFIIVLHVMTAFLWAEMDSRNRDRIVFQSCRPEMVLIPLSFNVPFEEMTAGNAVLHYRKAMVQIYEGSDFNGLREHLRSNSADSDYYEKVIQSNKHVYEEIRRGTLCDGCNWGELVYKETAGLEVSDIKGAMKLADLLSARIRYCLLKDNKDFVNMIALVRDGLKLAENLRKSVNHENILASLHIQRNCNYDISSLIQQPGVPRLYDALMTSMCDNGLYRMYQIYKSELWMKYPQRRKLCDFNMLQEERVALWNEYCESVHRELEKVDLMGTQVESNIRPEMLAVLKKDRARALRYFQEKGVAQEKIESVPKPILAEMYHICSYQEQLDTMYRFMKMEPWLVIDDINRCSKALFEESPFATQTYFGAIDIEIDTMNPYSPPLSTFARCYYLTVELEQQIRVLAVVEALREYYYGHQKLPESISDIPARLLVDPITGKGFEYCNNGNQSVINYDVVNGESDRESRQITIEIEK